MTTAIFLLLFFAFLVAVLNWLPLAGTVNPAYATAISSMIGYMKAWNYFFPITELLICVGIVVGYEVIVWSWYHVIVPLTRLIRGTTH